MHTEGQREDGSTSFRSGSRRGMLDDMRSARCGQVIVRSRWSGGEGMLSRGRDGGSEGDEGARAAAAAGRRLHRPRTSQPVTMPRSGFFSFPAADWRLCLRPIFGIPHALPSFLEGSEPFPFFPRETFDECFDEVLRVRLRNDNEGIFQNRYSIALFCMIGKRVIAVFCMIGKWAISNWCDRKKARSKSPGLKIDTPSPRLTGSSS